MRWFKKRRQRTGETEDEVAGHRAILVWIWLETLWLDFRFGARQLRKKPLLVMVAALSLALGIGANTAIFTVINAVLLRSLPVREPGRLTLFNDSIATGVTSGDVPTGDEFSYPFWQSIPGKIGAFEDLCAFRQSVDRATLHVAGVKDSGGREQTRVHLVSGNYFQVLGVSAAAGRLFEPKDDRLNAIPVAVISFAYWRERFGSDPTVLGSTALLNGTAFTVIGVTTPEFFGERIESRPDFWIPLQWQPQVLLEKSWINAHDVEWLNMLGRLKKGATTRQAETEVNLRFHEYLMEHFGEHPSAQKLREIAAARVHLKPGGGGISGLRFLYSEPLHILMGAVALVLFIACANVAILFLSRASARTQEFLARVALGASKARIIRQVLAESVLLSSFAGLAGIAFAWAGVKALTTLFGIGSVVKVKPDPLVLFFSAAVSIITGLLFGLLPAIRCSLLQPRVGVAVRRMEFGAGRFSSGRILIAGQVALSLMLLFGAALLAHSLAALEGQDLGFQRDHMLVVRTDPRLAGYEPTQLLPLYQQLDARLNAIPGVLSATVARYSPIDGTSSTDNFSIEGREKKMGERPILVDVEVGPHFFQTLRMPILYGRGIDERDVPSSPLAVVINQSFAREFFAGVNPLGQHIGMGSPFTAPGFEIVGVVADSRYLDAREGTRPMAFFSVWQGKVVTPYAGTLILSVAGDTGSIVGQARRVLQSIDSRLPILDVNTLDEQVEHSFRRQTIITKLCSLFALLALLLAAIGIYGSTAYLVARRTPEMGLRMALGAQRFDVLWMVLREDLVVIMAGLVAGVPCAFAATRLVRSFLFGVTAADPLAIGATLLVIAAASILAGYLPARRATRIDPMIALRYE